MDRDEIKLPEFDLLVCTLPCQNVTVLKQLNRYKTTKTAHLFTKSQLKFVKLVQPSRILNEMTSPRHDAYDDHEKLAASLREMGYHVATDNVDAAAVGDRTSHFRWFSYASKAPISSFDVLHDSGMELAPRAVEGILEPESDIPAELYTSSEWSGVQGLRHSVFAPALVQKTFELWKP